MCCPPPPRLCAAYVDALAARDDVAKMLRTRRPRRLQRSRGAGSWLLVSEREATPSASTIAPSCACCGTAPSSVAPLTQGAPAWRRTASQRHPVRDDAHRRRERLRASLHRRPGATARARGCGDARAAAHVPTDGDGRVRARAQPVRQRAAHVVHGARSDGLSHPALGGADVGAACALDCPVDRLPGAARRLLPAQQQQPATAAHSSVG